MCIFGYIFPSTMHWKKMRYGSKKAQNLKKFLKKNFDIEMTIQLLINDQSSWQLISYHRLTRKTHLEISAYSLNSSSCKHDDTQVSELFYQSDLEDTFLSMPISTQARGHQQFTPTPKPLHSSQWHPPLFSDLTPQNPLYQCSVNINTPGTSRAHFHILTTLLHPKPDIFPPPTLLKNQLPSPSFPSIR